MAALPRSSSPPLTLFVDHMSQPSRALIIFCRANGIPFSQSLVQIAKGQHKAQAFTEKFPLGKLPTIEDSGFRLAESHAILRYLAATRHCADHWYPPAPHARALVDMLLDWHHLNTRKGTATLVFQEVLAPIRKLPRNEGVVQDARATLTGALHILETVWLQRTQQSQAQAAPSPGQERQELEETGKFLLGAGKPSLADLSIACELTQLQMLGRRENATIFSAYPRVRQWLRDTQEELNPFWDEAHAFFYKINEKRERDSSEQMGSGGSLHRQQAPSAVGAASSPLSSSPASVAATAADQARPEPSWGVSAARVFSSSQDGRGDFATDAVAGTSGSPIEGTGMMTLHSPQASSRGIPDKSMGLGMGALYSPLQESGASLRSHL